MAALPPGGVSMVIVTVPLFTKAELGKEGISLRFLTGSTSLNHVIRENLMKGKFFTKVCTV